MRSPPTETDERWMRRALELARRGEGKTRPNPPVGAIVVRGGRCVGEGWHRRAGEAHAEALALRRAGARARGAALYVTLEPCCTWGRQPPCTEAILSAGVARVVASLPDPNPKHRGRGFRILRKAGVAVTVGAARAEAAELIAPFTKWIVHRRPYVTLKLALSLDGRIADSEGASRWITGPAARRAVQALRRQADAILVGRETVERDDPSLLPRPSLGREPWRVVADRMGRTPLKARLLQDEAVERTLIAVSERCPAEREAALRATGAQVERLPETEEGISPAALLEALGRRGLLHVVCEGGGALAGSLVRAGCVDEFWFFLAPKLLGAAGAAAIAGGWPMAEAPALEWVGGERVGRDWLIRARPAKRFRRESGTSANRV